MTCCLLHHIEDIPSSDASDWTQVVTDNAVALERPEWEKLGSDVFVAYETEVPWGR